MATPLVECTKEKQWSVWSYWNQLKNEISAKGKFMNGLKDLRAVLIKCGMSDNQL